MVRRPDPVGAHYGLRDWVIQRVSAVVMLLYTLYLIALVIAGGGPSYALLSALRGSTTFKLATFVFMAALLYHAWIGVRDIYMDYLHAAGVRLALESITVVVLIAYLGWTIQILWGAP